MHRRLIRNNGSVMLWSLGIMAIVVVVSAVILMTGASYYRQTMTDICQKKAQLLSRSGLTYAIQRITCPDDTGDYSWQPDDGAFEIGIVSLSERTVYFDGVKRSDEHAVISFDAVQTDDGYLLRVISRAEAGGIASQSVGVFSYGGDGLWHFVGCAG